MSYVFQENINIKKYTERLENWVTLLLQSKCAQTSVLETPCSGKQAGRWSLMGREVRSRVMAL